MDNTEEIMISENENGRLHDFQNQTLSYRNALYNYALKIARNSDDAQDLVQETFYKAYKSYHQFEHGTNSKAWMFMILKNTFINNYRKFKRETTKLDHFENEELNEKISFDKVNDLNMDFCNDMLDDELSVALAKLPLKMKEIILLCDLESYTYEEAAELNNIPIGTVRSRLHRARKFLQYELSDYAKVNGYLN